MPHDTLRQPTATTAGGWPGETDRFADRTDAGRILGAALAGEFTDDTDPPLVLGLSRGGMPVAREVAKALGADLDILVTRRIGLPWQPGFGIGAIVDDGPALFDRNALACAGVVMTALAPAVRRERLEVRRRHQRYRGDRPATPVKGRTVVITDDGLASGIVARAAVRSVRAGDPARVVYAAPVCAAETADQLDAEADDVRHLHSPRAFHAHGLWYRELTPVTDDDVATILALAWGAPSRTW